MQRNRLPPPEQRRMLARLAVFAMTMQMFLCSVSGAQPPASQPNADVDEAIPAERLTLEEIATQREKIASLEELDDEIRVAALDYYDSASRHLKQAQLFVDALRNYKALSGSVDQRIQEAEQRLRRANSTQPAMVQSKDPRALNEQSVRLQASVEELRKALKEIDGQIKTRPRRRQEIQSRLATADDEVKRLERELAAVSTTGEAPLLTVARRTDLLALVQQLEAERPAMEAELALYAVEEAAGLANLQRETVVAELLLAEQELAVVNTAVQSAREESARETIERTNQEADEVDPTLSEIAARNKELAAANSELASKVADYEADRERIAKETEALRSTFETSRQKVESLRGLPASLGAVLRKQRAELTRVSTNRAEINARKLLIDESQLALFDYDEGRASLLDNEQAIRRQIDLATSSVAKKSRLKSQLHDLISSQRTLLDSLWETQNAAFKALTDASTEQEQLVQITEEFADFIDERVLWIQSGSSMVQKSFWSDLVASEWRVPAFSTVGDFLRQDFRKNISTYTFALVLLVVVLRIALGSKPILAELAATARRGSCASFLPTIRAMILTVATSLPIPLFLAFLSWRLATADDDANSTATMADGLIKMALLVFPFELMRQICKPDGIADAHFQWTTSSIATLRKWFTVLVLTVPVLVLLMTVVHGGLGSLTGSTMERLVFMVVMAIFALFTYNVLHPHRGAFAEYLNRWQDGWLYRLRYVILAAMILFPILLIGLSAAGYFYTARQLGKRFHFTISLLSAAIVLYSLVARLILIQRRKLRIAQARKRQSTALAEQVGAAVAPVVEDIPLSDLRDQTHQTRRFAALLFSAAVLLGIWFTWHDVLPALSFLERWPLWTSTQTQMKPISDASGVMSVKAVDVDDPVTIVELLFAIFVGIVSLVASQNLPGMLEIAVLQRLPLESSVRYAISTIGKYLIMLFGLFAAFRIIGLRWGQIQWMATALTFGLAFGLQEMFANFVAGIILLFERPIRVGDIVTVDEVTGIVNRIRMRATTITNYDRKDYIVPNKDFITGRVLNWTLSDQVNRIVIPVGVEYGSDKQMVKETLLRIASENEIIVDEPPPQVTFENFADSSLTFVLRCYISMRDMPHRLDVIDFLYSRIDDAFRSEGIEIAYPQQDLHIKTMPPGLTMGKAK